MVGADQYHQYYTVGGAGQRGRTAQAVIGSGAAGSSGWVAQAITGGQHSVVRDSTGGHFNLRLWVWDSRASGTFRGGKSGGTREPSSQKVSEIGRKFSGKSYARHNIL